MPKFRLGIPIFALALVASFVAFSGTRLASADVSTDKYLYGAGDTVAINGNNVDPNEAVTVRVFDPSNLLVQEHVVTSDGAGAFADSYTLSSAPKGGVYSIVAYAPGGASVQTFQTTFDPPSPPASLFCPTLSSYTNGHDYILTVNTSVTCYLINATDAGAASTIPVIIKNSDTANTNTTGSLVACPSPWAGQPGPCYQFSLTAPVASCNTGPVSYISNGNAAVNDIVDNGFLDGSGKNPSGFAYFQDGSLKTTCGGVVTTKGSHVDTTVIGPDGSGNIAIGSAVRDSATVTVDSPGTVPAGSKVTFTLYKGPFSGGTCPSGGTVVGTPEDVTIPGTSSPQTVQSTPISNLIGGSYAYVASFTSGNSDAVSNSTGICEPFTVTAKDLTAVKTANPTFTRTFKWGITKDVDKTEIDVVSGGSATFNYTVKVTHDAGTDSAWRIAGTITVSNPNAVAVTGVSVNDAVLGGGCSFTSANTGLTVAANDAINVGYACTFGANPGSGTNLARIQWDDIGSPTTKGTASVPFTFGDPTTIVDASATISDPLYTGGTPAGTLGVLTSSDPSPKTYNYSNTVTAPTSTCTTVKNTATVTTNTTATTGSDSETVKVCGGSDLTVAKTAAPTFTRTYNWDLTKTADCDSTKAGNQTTVDQLSGSATCSYSVTATELGFTDSLWKVAGNITVSNPNDWEAITANVNDGGIVGANCTVTGGIGVSVPKSGNAVLPYVCTFAAAPSPTSGNNTARVTWDKAAFFTPTGQASGQASFAFGAPTTTVNKTITVNDSFNSGPATTLGTATATDSTPYTVKLFPVYTHVISVTVDKCMTYPNTATIVETSKTATASVTVCGPAVGGLTIGFWHNKNGQGIITGGSSTSNVCNSGTWLKQFAPFQDLKANATCADVAAYFLTAFNAASCGGSTCNPMLKAQMLATALNVYFSDPALGGNKISAPMPLGGLKIDLTKICQMIDASGGTATCNGTYENVSSAFGGATSMTVSAMLTYAAGQSNAGGSSWYGNVKATQVLAKDAFDAINNQVGFIAP